MKNFEKYILDLGTGDGRFVFKNALNNPQNMYIGIDPIEKQYEKYLRKVNRRRLDNAKFLVGSIENLPQDLPKFDEIYITLPWGSLLEVVVKPTENTVNILSNLLKQQGKIEIVFGYEKELEPSKTSQSNMPELSEEYVRGEIVGVFTKNNTFTVENISKLRKENLKKLNSSWAKKLVFGGDRNFFKIIFTKV